MLLMIDNYDSFTYNLVQYFGELGEDVRVYRNDQITVEQIAELAPDRPPRLVRRARPGRDHEAVGCEFGDLLNCDLVVAEHAHVLAQLAEVLHEVVGERIIVVDHQ